MERRGVTVFRQQLKLNKHGESYIQWYAIWKDSVAKEVRHGFNADLTHFYEQCSFEFIDGEWKFINEHWSPEQAQREVARKEVMDEWVAKLSEQILK